MRVVYEVRGLVACIPRQVRGVPKSVETWRHRRGGEACRRFSECLPKNLGSARILRAVSGILPGTSASGWPREVQPNIRAISQPNIRAISHSSDVEVLMAVGRKQMLLAFPPDHLPRWYPTLTRLGLVQRWAVLEIPLGISFGLWWPPRNRCHPLAQSKFFLEEDGATSPTLTSFQRVYVGYGCWRFLLRRSCGGRSAFRIQVPWQALASPSAIAES